MNPFSDEEKANKDRRRDYWYKKSKKLDEQFLEEKRFFFYKLNELNELVVII